MSGRSEALEDDVWYAWEEDASEQGWLLSYVDVLSVILAMLLVLLVSSLHRQSTSEDQASTEVETPELVSVSVAADAAPVSVPIIIEPSAPLFSPLPASLPPPPPAPIPRPQREITAIDVSGADVPTRQASQANSDQALEGLEIVHHDDAVTLQVAEVVLFDSSRAALKRTGTPVLERAALLLNEFGEVDVAVQGHTDNRPVRGGEFRSNWELAAARANAVAAFLLQQGFPPDRLRVESYADTRPVAGNDTSSGRAKNRRVELHVELPPVEEAVGSAD